MVRKRLEVKEDLQTRVNIFSVVVIVALLLILARLWFLQVIMGSEFNSMSNNNKHRELTIEAVRGNIYDRNKKIVVTSKPALSIVVDPQVFPYKKDVQKRLSKLIGTPIKEILKRMNSKRTPPLQPKVIKRSVNREIVYYIKERPQEFEGVKVEVRPERDYLYGTLASHLFGYVGEVSDNELRDDSKKQLEMGDIVGKTGLENFFNESFMGIKGREVLETNAAGRPVRVVDRKTAEAGSSVLISMDLKIQKAAEDALRSAMKMASKTFDEERKKNYSPKGGAVVVMDPRNGDVVAMASYPTFSPNAFLGGISSKEWKALNDPRKNYPMNNRAVTSSYPPGSTFKPFVAIAGLESGVITANTPHQCSGSWKGSEKWPNSFRCWKKTGHGVSNLRRAMQVSCDIYFYNVGYDIYKTKKESIQNWANLFGFGNKTQITLPYETSGRIPTKKWKRWLNRAPGNEAFRSWLPGDSVNLSIGQGDVLSTPMQMASATSVIANGGTLYKPRLIKSYLSVDADVKRAMDPKVIRRLNVKPGYFKAVRDGMEAVTTGEGTASGIFDGLGVQVAGKSGTAEVRNKQPTAWFISYAPAEKPRYVVVMVIEEGGHGGSVAAPAIRDIYAKIFNKKIKEDPAKKTIGAVSD